MVTTKMRTNQWRFEFKKKKKKSLDVTQFKIVYADQPINYYSKQYLKEIKLNL